MQIHRICSFIKFYFSSSEVYKQNLRIFICVNDMDELNPILPIYKKAQSLLSLQEFHNRVNVIFHDHEAVHYDELHADMLESLQEQFDFLASDTDLKMRDNKIVSLLDFGCGTALATQMFLKTSLAQNCQEITLFDTSAQMLERAKAKSKNWSQQVQIIHERLPDFTGKFDAVMLSSVLHHIPNLQTFLKNIESLLRPGGIFIHLQDPNKDSDSDPERIERELLLKSRMQQQAVHSSSIKHFLPKKWRNQLNRMLGRKTYIDRINDDLLREKVIRKRLTADDLWKVTDIQISESGYGGISMKELKTVLTNFQLITHRSYAFYGVLKHDLPADLIPMEDEWAAKGSLNGRNVAAIWQKIE